MDMKINKEILRRERELRAWTQSHLAEVADLSMRTVQRIERTGDVSMESAGALATALNIDLAVLMEAPIAPDEITPAKSRPYKLWSAIGVISAILVFAGWWSSAAAEQVMVSLSIEASGRVYSDMMLLNEVGRESEMTLDNQFRMLFSTNRQGEHLLISAKIYNFVEDGYQLVSSPAMLVEDQKPASMQVTFPDGHRVNLQLMADF
jgi:transcriptional regulator with XRE-family HTH domain